MIEDMTWQKGERKGEGREGGIKERKGVRKERKNGGRHWGREEGEK